MSFTTRGLSGSEPLGQRLRQLRQEAHVSVEQLAGQLQVPAKYLTLIESGEYQKLPGLVYARNFVRAYIRWVGLQEAAAMQKFEVEYQLVQAARPSKHPLLTQRANTEVQWWRRHARLLLAVAIVLVAVGFFGWQILRLFLPPQLLVTDPAHDIRTSQAQIIVRGQTVPGATVRMNNDTVEIDDTGKFQERVDLKPGLNAIEITAKKDRSGERVVLRQILFEPKK